MRLSALVTPGSGQVQDQPFRVGTLLQINCTDTHAEWYLYNLTSGRRESRPLPSNNISLRVYQIVVSDSVPAILVINVTQASDNGTAYRCTGEGSFDPRRLILTSSKSFGVHD